MISKKGWRNMTRSEPYPKWNVAAKAMFCVLGLIIVAGLIAIGIQCFNLGVEHVLGRGRWIGLVYLIVGGLFLMKLIRSHVRLAWLLVVAWSSVPAVAFLVSGGYQNLEGWIHVVIFSIVPVLIGSLSSKGIRSDVFA